MAPERPRLKDEQSWKNYSGNTDIRGAWQTWHQSGRCPKGTVPIRRSSVDDVLRAKSLYYYGKKQGRGPFARPTRAQAPDVISGNGHEVCSMKFLFLLKKTKGLK